MLSLKNRVVQIKEYGNSSFNELLDILFCEENTEQSFKADRINFKKQLDRIPIVNLGLDLKSFEKNKNNQAKK